MTAVANSFDSYQKSRVSFVQTIAELAREPENIEGLQSAGVMSLLRPLLQDSVPSIQQSAALALARLANYSEELAEAIVSNDILPHLVYSLREQNRFYKKAAAYVLRAVARHSEQLAKAVVEAGALESLVQCLKEFDPSVKEAAAFALAYISKHTPELAQGVVDADALPLLLICLQEPEPKLKTIAAAALSEIAHHTPELATCIVDLNALPYLTGLMNYQDLQVKKYVCACLSHIAKHSPILAGKVARTDMFTRIMQLLKETDVQVKKNAASCIREITKHSAELANDISHAGGINPIIDYLIETKGTPALPGITTLGYLAAFDQELANNVVSAKAVKPLHDALKMEPDSNVKATAAWSLGQIGRHSAENSKALAEEGVLATLTAIYIAQESTDDLRNKAKKALKNIIRVCECFDKLQDLLKDGIPTNILKYVVARFTVLLQQVPEEKKGFVKNQGLKQIQRIKAAPGSKLREYIDEINNLYPPEIVQYYVPDYQATLLRKLEEFHQDI